MNAHIAGFAELTTGQLYDLLRLRSEVFVVEQRSLYLDPDGRDREPDTRHIWLTDDDDRPVAYLRVLKETDGAARIGRVCVAPAGRGAGAAQRLMILALAAAGPRCCVLDAQSYLVPFYERLGFVVVGPEYDDEGVLHVPMERPMSDLLEKI